MGASIVDPHEVIRGAKDITLQYSGHKMGETVDPSTVGGNYVIDHSGNIISNGGGSGNITIVIIGGDFNHNHSLTNDEDGWGYDNQAQRYTMQNIMRAHGHVNKYTGGYSQSGDQGLDQAAISAFDAGRG